MNYKFTIIVPVYNEADNLIRLEQELNHFIKIAKYKTKVILINDGSTDASQTLIQSICSKNEHFSHILLKTNQGLSAALKAGFNAVNTRYLGYIDGDLQTHPNDFNLLLNHIEHYDLVTGIREHRQDDLIKRISSKLANSARRMFTQDGIKDSGCPLKVFKTKSAQAIPMFKGMHRFLPALIQLEKGKVKQVPISHYLRIAGETKFGVWRRLFSTFIDCFIFLWMKKRYIKLDINSSKS